ncbi:MAG: PRD domain-containing protein [Lacrimispora sp.]
MKIKRIYNNNILMVNNDNGDEAILVGRGIAYGLKKGDVISEERADKKFELKGEAKHRFEKMLQEISLDYILISEEIIAYIKDNSDKKIADGIYVTLTDHIANTMERIRMGINFDMTMLLNVKSLYRREHRLALHAIEMLREAFGLEIDDSEANFITLHIVNAESESNMMQMYAITAILEEISDIVGRHFQINTHDNFDYDRFITHCRFFIHRVVNNEYLEKSGLVNIEIFQIMKEQSPKQCACIGEITGLIEEKYDYAVDDEEKLYLLIHLNKLTK